MNVIWLDLIANLAIAALLTSVWSQATDWLDARRRAIRQTVIGLGLGFGTVAIMVMAVELRPGVMFDLRTAVLAVGSFFGGPIPALIAVAISGAYRLFIGGAGAPVGVAAMALAAIMGLIARRLSGHPPRRRAILALGAAIGLLTMAAIMALPVEVRDHAIKALLLPCVLLSVLAVLMMGFAMHEARRNAHYRHILLTALEQSPDFQYVKDTNSRFIAVNQAVALNNGFKSPSQMVGKTDFDFSQPSHAKRLFEQEQRMLLTGRNIEGVEEQIVDDGGRRWFLTSKSIIHDPDGNPVGMAGVSIDITARKELEGQLRESRNLLSLALQEMSDGLAMFDAEGFLVFCNEQYRSAFPKTGHLRRPGAHISNILKGVVATGEQTQIPADKQGEWIEQTAIALQSDCIEEVSLSDGRFLRLRNHPISSGGAVTVVTEVTDLKRAELALKRSNAHLAELATTDGLTLMPNRRAFNDTLKRELARSRRARSHFSLLMLDVDHFKAYNDRYGHQAGDRCLKMIAQCMKTALRRPADMAARYGGEEFSIILPDTDEEGALFVAQAIAEKVKADRLIHEGSDKGMVTVSIGVSTYTPADDKRDSADLIRRADKALYQAKNEGRDRIIAWQNPEAGKRTRTA